MLKPQKNYCIAKQAMNTIKNKINQIKDFKNYLVQLGYGKNTVSMVVRCMEDFLDYHPATDTEDFTAGHIHQYYDYLQIRPHKHKGGGLSEQYINHHVYALRVFFNWLEATQGLTGNPMSVLRFKHPKGNPRQPLSQEEIKALFENAQSVKETALLHIFYSCGLRRSEAVDLEIKDIHFKTRILYVREGKGAKRRAVPMTERVSKDLESYYLQERITQVRVKDAGAFMLGVTGRRMCADAYNKTLKILLERAGLSKEISLHYLRHSIATHLLESGLAIEYVRDFLGHRHLETTQIYAKVHAWQLQKL